MFPPSSSKRAAGPPSRLIMGTPTNASTQQKAAESDKAVKLEDKVLAKAEQKI